MKTLIAGGAIAFALLVVATPATATTWYILADQSGDAPTIQAGLDACAAGDSVLVAAGTYLENLIWPDTQSIVLISESGPEATIIDGGAAGRVILMNVAVDLTTEINGFTVQNGALIDESGAGIRCYEASPTIRGNVFTNNQIAGSQVGVGGAGIACSSASPLIVENTIAFNSITSGSEIGNIGAGLMLSHSSATILDNVITDNTLQAAALFGVGGGIGVIYMVSVPHIEGNLIARNEASMWGGGVYFHGGTSGTLVDNEIVDNTAQIGGGLFLLRAFPTVRDNLITENVASSTGGGIGLQYTHGLGEIAAITHNRILKNVAMLGTGGGIHVAGASPLIEDNVIKDNGIGICCNNLETDQSNPVIRNNYLIGNWEYGVVNLDATVTVDATMNWWGDDSGPTCDLNPEGCGDEVTDYVAFDPWLPSPKYVMLEEWKHFDDVMNPGETLFIRPGGFDGEWTLQHQTVYNADGTIQIDVHQRLQVDSQGCFWGFGYVEAPSNPEEPILRVLSPLYVGQTWMSSVFYPGHGLIERTFTCTAETTITVGYGDVECFEVEEYQDDVGTISRGTIWYAEGIGRVKLQNPDYDFELRSITTAVDDLPESATVGPVVARPNPFNPRTTIEFTLERAQEASVAIYDLRGRHVRDLVAGELAAGRQELVWNGENDADAAMPSGVYVVRLVAADGIQASKVMLVR